MPERNERLGEVRAGLVELVRFHRPFPLAEGHRDRHQLLEP